MDTATLTVPAETASVVRCTEVVARYAKASGLPLDRVRAVELVVEEVVLNICSYAYDVPGEIQVCCKNVASQDFVLEFTDRGKPFNILALPAPDLTLEVDERPVGGLGVPLVRAIAGTASYRRENDQNILRVSVPLPH